MLDDQGARSVPGVGGLFPEGTARIQLVPGQAAVGDGDLRQHAGIAVQVLVGHFSCCHALPRILPHS
ncbi:hypothetical protein [Streptomyces sp. A5-4]|uniref:hypothetical protein n=1 Tax=Streptomyces sp. A5-4 TaxID=3384771 RepID=UPI003DA7E7E2